MAGGDQPRGRAGAGDRSGGMLGVEWLGRGRNPKGLKAEELGLKEQVDICGVFFSFFFCPLSSAFGVF